MRANTLLVAICALASASVLVALPTSAIENLEAPRAAAGSIAAEVMNGGAPPAAPLTVSKNPDERAKQLRDKMPYFSREPRIVGNAVVFSLDVSPMREAGGAGSARLDRVSGRLTISRKGIDLLDPAVFAGPSDGKVLLDKAVPARIVKSAGDQNFSIPVPAAVATSLRALSPSQLGRRLRIVMRDEKDIDPAVAGYDRIQITASNLPPSIREYLASRRNSTVGESAACSAPCRRAKAALSSGEGRRGLLRSLPMKPPPNSTPGTMVVFNGSPFDLSVAMNNVQCMTPYLVNWSLSPGTVASNTSFEFPQVAEIAGNTFYTQSLQQLQYYATKGMKSLESAAMTSLERAAFLKHITQSASRGLVYFGSSMFFDITLNAVAAAIANSNACTNAGSAINLSWTVTDVGASQTDGNVNYWVPSYSRTTALGIVRPTSIPSPAPGSPLNAYNATSANGLAVSAAQLQSQLGAGGSVTLSTLNSNQQNGSYNGFWCNYRNQQASNPNSSSSVNYGSSALGGGLSPDWGACNATSVTGSHDTLQNLYGISNASQLENEGFSILIGYSTTSMATAGPSPALAPQVAASSTACLATNAPCVYTIAPTSSSPNLIVGCTPGTWNMLTPWNGSSPTMNLSSPPSAYNSVSTLTTQLAFTGVTASGTTVTELVPGGDGGTVTSSFSPSAVNLFTVTPTDMTTIQTVLGGPGSYVASWSCVLTANTTVPSGIQQTAPSAVAMNLVWYGVPVAATAPNPPGTPLSPPA